MQEEQSCLENISNEYTYRDWIKKLKSPKVIATGKNIEGYSCVIYGDSPKEVYQLAKENHVIHDLILTIPHKHIFNL